MKALTFFLLLLILMINSNCKDNQRENLSPSNWSIIDLQNNIQGYEKILFLDAKNGCLTHGYTIDSNGNLIEQIQTFTNDSGKTWNSYSIQNLVQNGFRNICKTPNGILYATANSGAIYTQAIKTLFTSKDKGISWQKVEGNYPNIDGNSFLYFSDEVTGIISTVAGIQRTTDAGKTWSIVYPEREPYQSTFFVNSEIGFVLSGYFLDDRGSGLGITNYGSLFKITDAGKTWKKLSGIDRNVNSLFFLNKNVGFVAVTNDNSIDELFKTTDGGITWISINAKPPISLTKMFFFSEQKGIAFGGVSGKGCGIYTTKDGGATWVQDIYLSNTTFYDASIIDENNIFVLAKKNLGSPPYGNNIILKKISK